jgi:hypothetical protein
MSSTHRLELNAKGCRPTTGSRVGREDGMARAVSRLTIFALLVLFVASCGASGSSQGHPADEGLVGTFDAPLGALATANATRIDPSRLPTLTFVPLTLPGVTPVAAWTLGQAQVGLTLNDPRYGRFGLNEGPGIGDFPSPTTRFDSAGPIHGRLITNRKGETASLTWATAVAVDWMHDGVTVGIIGAPHGFTQQQAEAVAKALRPAGSPVAAAALRRAIDACRAASRHASFVNAQATTVGAMHAITGGPSPNMHPWRSLFPHEPANAFAAWCWQEPRPHIYRSYAVGPKGTVNFLGNNIGRNGEPPPDPGPLAVT